MAKIPVTLEAGTADKKLAFSDNIYDKEKEKFQSDINKETEERLNDVKDTLESDSSTAPLSANQGRILKELLDAKVIEAGGVPFDTTPTEGHIDHVVTSDGLAKEFNKVDEHINIGENTYISDITSIVNSPEFVYAKVDNEGKILLGIKVDGSIYFGAGIPEQIKTYVITAISKSEISVKQEIKEIKIDLESYKESNNIIISAIQQALESIETRIAQDLEIDEFIQVTIDNSGKIIQAVKPDGTVVVPIIDLDYVNIKGNKIDSEVLLHNMFIDNPEFIELTLDDQGHIIKGVKTDGTVFISKLESPTLTEIKDTIKTEIQPQLDELSKEIKENLFAIECDEDGNLIAVFDDNSNISDVGITEDGEIYCDFNIV